MKTITQIFSLGLYKQFEILQVDNFNLVDSYLQMINCFEHNWSVHGIIPSFNGPCVFLFLEHNHVYILRAYISFRRVLLLSLLITDLAHHLSRHRAIYGLRSKVEARA